jgi:hypothetical protein
VADDTIEYSVTIYDPAVWSRPWTLMVRAQDPQRGTRARKRNEVELTRDIFRLNIRWDDGYAATQ